MCIPVLFFSFKSKYYNALKAINMKNKNIRNYNKYLYWSSAMTDGFSDIFTPGVVGISLTSSAEYLCKRDLYESTKFPVEKNVIIQFSF